jgi:hypothetical protein
MTESEANQLFILFSKIGTITILIPISLAIWQRKYLNQPLKIFLWYRIFALGINFLEQAFVWFATKYFQLLQPYLKYWDISDTNFLLILFYINDYIFLGLFFYILLGYKPDGIWIWRIAMLLLLTNVINYCFIEGYKVYGFFNPTSDAIFVFGVAAFYLWHLYKSQLVLPLTRNPYFWICFGLILPHLIGFFLFLVGDVALRTNFPLFVSLSIAKNCFLILAQIFYAIAFWRAPYARFIPLPSEEKTA